MTYSGIHVVPGASVCCRTDINVFRPPSTIISNSRGRDLPVIWLPSCRYSILSLPTTVRSLLLPSRCAIDYGLSTSSNSHDIFVSRLGCLHHPLLAEHLCGRPRPPPTLPSSTDHSSLSTPPSLPRSCAPFLHHPSCTDRSRLILRRRHRACARYMAP